MEKTKLQQVYFEGEKPVKIKAYYKYELAALYEVCTKTFSSWINTSYLEELKQFGYKKSTKLLRPEVVRFLFERLGEP
ncbi:DUF4248 domain-containing protein [Aquimarina sediminis]|uniref:DUF4248 domain-containing protein n=1 Tax=Aquimarina sediminis TaxID=2070536 RepID=UPI001F4E5300|nr:DUF4248 domain-containing protein [Aquimarina sediminis]